MERKMSAGTDGEEDEWMTGGQLQQCEGDRSTPRESDRRGEKAPEERQRGKNNKLQPSANIEEEEMEGGGGGGGGREGEGEFSVN
ncbi:Hypothetical predicted protein [Scomber scombrus]|uniref:Uncharacterized protein n=1 Tax=Scomber scombrus TaxID=13677 RepID=A0AAV1Q5Y6_SCOSC